MRNSAPSILEGGGDELVPGEFAHENILDVMHGCYRVANNLVLGHEVEDRVLL